jgi:S-adenosylmethionine hydrolase
VFALFTDYGTEGPYVGQVHARLAGEAPGTPVIDLFHDLPAFDVRAAAYLLPAYTRDLPAGTICICVVDPGVGGDRGGAVVRAHGHWYLGPDNGLMAILVRRDPAAVSWPLDWRPAALSASFHGRDWFAPAAVRLSRGELPVGEPRALSVTVTDWPDDWAGILYIDRFGNAITGLRAEAVATDAALQVGDHVLPPARVFGDVAPGTPFWYPNANGLVEIAVNRGRADRLPGVTPGAPVTIAGSRGRADGSGRPEARRHA